MFETRRLHATGRYSQTASNADSARPTQHSAVQSSRRMPLTGHLRLNVLIVTAFSLIASVMGIVLFSDSVIVVAAVAYAMGNWMNHFLSIHAISRFGIHTGDRS